MVDTYWLIVWSLILISPLNCNKQPISDNLLVNLKVLSYVGI